MISDLMHDLTQYAALAPEALLGLSSLIFLLLGVLLKKDNAYKVVYVGTMLSLAGALWLSMQKYHFVQEVNVKYIITQPVFIVKRFLLFTAIAVFSLSYGLAKRNTRLAVFEYPILFMTCVLGMMVSISASDFLVLYLGLELQALAMYIMITLDRDDIRASEAGLKYYLLSGVASAFMLYGFSIIYGMTGAIDFHDISNIMNASHDSVFTYLFCVMGVVFILGGFCFKMAAFPMHSWAPDVYQGASSVITTFVATVPKIVAFVVMNRLFYVSLSSFVYYQHFHYLICCLAVASMVVGLLGALRQSKIKRLIAYSSIQNMGYVLLLTPAVSGAVVEIVLSYIFVYASLVIGIFACLMRLVGNDRIVADIKLDDLAGLIKRDRFAAVSLAILMLSIAGIPPVAGFFAKLFLFAAAFYEGMRTIVVVAALLSVASMYYYLNIIKIMFFDQYKQGMTPDGTQTHPELTPYNLGDGKTKTGSVVILGCVLFNIILAVKPDMLLHIL